MPELKDFASSVAIVVSSCDAFFDAWRPFVFFFRKHWSDCPFPIFLIVNRLRVRSEIVQPIAVGPDRDWAADMEVALNQIPQPYILYFQEDSFLNGPVQREQLAADFVYAFEHDAASFCFYGRSKLEENFVRLNNRFGVVPPDSDGRARNQFALRKRESFLSILREGESGWESELRGSDRTRTMKMLSYNTRDDAPVPYLMSAIVRGLWTLEAIAMCQEARLKIEPCFHSPNKFIRRLRRAQTRMRLKHELARARGEVIAIS